MPRGRSRDRRERYMRDRAERRRERRDRERAYDYAMNYERGRNQYDRGDYARGRDRYSYDEDYREYARGRDRDYDYDMRGDYRDEDYARRGVGRPREYNRRDRGDYRDYAEKDYEEEYEEDLEKWIKKLKKQDRFGLSKEQVMQKAKDMKVTFDEYEPEEFYAIYLMHVSDYPTLANEPHTYLAMAKAWLEDKDIEIDPSEKVCKYMYEIVMADDED